MKNIQKKIRILYLETHYSKDANGSESTHGVDYARIVNPAKALMNHPDFTVEIRKDPTVGHKEKNWDEVCKAFDIIHTSYIDTPTGYVHLAIFTRKNHIPYVTDLDDNLWEIPQHSPTYEVFQPGSDKLNAVSLAMEDTPYMSTSNLFLKYRLVKYVGKRHEEIKVLPNFIDLSLYNYRNIPEQKPKKIIIGYYGTNTHTRDALMLPFAQAIARITQEFPDVYFKTTGFFLPQIKSALKNKYIFNLGEQRFDKWIPLWEQLMSETSIAVAPLEETDFNRCKSNIKYLENSAGKKPGVYQDIRQYQEMVKSHNGTPTGFLAHTKEQWYEHLKALVESEELRKKVGQAAYDFVKENHTIQGNIELYADYYKEVIEKHKRMGNLLQEGFVLPGTEVVA